MEQPIYITFIEDSKTLNEKMRELTYKTTRFLKFYF